MSPGEIAAARQREAEMKRKRAEHAMKGEGPLKREWNDFKHHHDHELGAKAEHGVITDALGVSTIDDLPPEDKNKKSSGSPATKAPPASTTTKEWGQYKSARANNNQLTVNVDTPTAAAAAVSEYPVEKLGTFSPLPVSLRRQRRIRRYMRANKLDSLTHARLQQLQ